MADTNKSNSKTSIVIKLYTIMLPLVILLRNNGITTYESKKQNLKLQKIIMRQHLDEIYFSKVFYYL